VTVGAPTPSRLRIDTGSLRAGHFAVGRDHPEFAEAGQMRRHEFVFPRTSVWIEHEGERPFIADPTVVTYYNRHEPYRRRVLSAEGDRCDWYSFDTAVLTDLVGHLDPSAEDRPERPFRFRQGPTDPVAYAQQRLVAHHLDGPEPADLVQVEEVMLDVLARVLARSYAARGLLVPAPSVAKLATAQDVVQRVRAYALVRLDQHLTLSTLARRADCSPFQLCRAFRQATGGTVHRWLLRLRLLASLERVAEPRSDLTTVALDFGFASHSHFTAAFRRAFGLTPSDLRRRAQARTLARLRVTGGCGQRLART
jgi:AraC family transcriptional regulator